MSKAQSNSFESVPVHLAIIMDGNGRWAKERGLPRSAGHRKGFLTFKSIVEESAKLGVSYLSVFAFSIENWNRDKKEIKSLMKLMTDGLNKYIPDMEKNNLQLLISGDVSMLDLSIQDMLENAVKRLANNTGMVVNICLSYGGRQEILNAVNKLLNKGISLVDEAAFAKELYTSNIPDPDLIIRTSGEYRVSNFLLWQSAYSEFYFTDTYWPDFDSKELEKAFLSFSVRERRFGKN